MNNNDKNKKDPLLLDHEYDGIKELDNPLPKWWQITFYGTVVFAFFYFFYYQLATGPTLKDEFEKDMIELEKIKLANAPKFEEFNQEKYNGFIANPEKLKQGEEVFVNNCIPCHKEKGQGDIGPNLTDEFWKNGAGTPIDIFKVVSNGVEENGMPVWKEVLTSDEILAVTGYIKSIKGVKLPGAKEPQGNKYEN